MARQVVTLKFVNARVGKIELWTRHGVWSRRDSVLAPGFDATAGELRHKDFGHPFCPGPGVPVANPAWQVSVHRSRLQQISEHRELRFQWANGGGARKGRPAFTTCLGFGYCTVTNTPAVPHMVLNFKSGVRREAGCARAGGGGLLQRDQRTNAIC